MLAAVFFALQAYAYRPMLENGNMWISKYRDSRMGFEFGHEFYQVTGDTLLAGKHAKIIDEWFVPGADMAYEYTYTFKPFRRQRYLCEEDNKIYQYTSKGTYELMMDFSCSIGDKFHREEIDYLYQEIERDYTVVQIDTITIGLGWQFRRITLKSLTTPQVMVASMEYGEDYDDRIEDTHEWIEGVGAMHTGDFLSSSIDANAFYRSELEAFIPATRNPYFMVEDYKKLPPATVAIESVEADPTAEADDTLYDLEGRRVTQPTAGHIYIRGGKKIVWKD